MFYDLAMNNSSFIRSATHATFIVGALFLSVVCMRLGFWQLERIQTEQQNLSKLTAMASPTTDLKKFAYIDTIAKPIPGSHITLRQIKAPNIAGYAHLALFSTKEFGPLLVMYGWDTKPERPVPELSRLEGKALPFSHIKHHKLLHSSSTDWAGFEQTFKIQTPSYFITTSSYANAAYFQQLYRPKYSTHYSYSFQFFLMSILFSLSAGFIFYRKCNYETKG